MKEYNVDQIEKSFETLKELYYDIMPYLRDKQAYYARLAGYSRQYVHELIKHDFESTTKHLDIRRVLRLYEVIRDDLKGIYR